MRYSVTLATGLIFATFAHAASNITSGGVPSGFKRPARPARNPTDFNSIFSEIIKHKGGSSKTPRDNEARDVTPPVPNFFELTFGPTNGANNANGYMGFVSLPTYDVAGCAAACNTRGFDASSGPCIYFNIWTPVVNGTATTSVCSLYNTVTDSSTATNTGQTNIQVTNSRGYSRVSLIQDGSFQDYTCVLTANSGCPFVPSAFWTRDIPQPDSDFILVDNFPAHSGTSSAFFFFAPVEPADPFIGSTLTYALNLNAVPGKTYIVSLFYTLSDFSPPPASFDGPLMSALWNGVPAINVEQSGPSSNLDFFNIQAEVVARGGDTFVLQDGVSYLHAMYVDDIAIFEKWF